MKYFIVGLFTLSILGCEETRDSCIDENKIKENIILMILCARF